MVSDEASIMGVSEAKHKKYTLVGPANNPHLPVGGRRYDLDEWTAPTHRHLMATHQFNMSFQHGR